MIGAIAEIMALRKRVKAKDDEIEQLREAVEIVSDVLEFHDGSEEKLTEQGEPVIWINASSPDGDFQTMLKAVRFARGLAKQESIS